MKKRLHKADIPEGGDSPLNAAVARRDQSTMQMVEEAVKHNECMLAFQPVVQSLPPQHVAFYEGFIRVLDATKRVIPAREFMPFVEDREVGRELDCVALEHGLRALSKNDKIRLSINMSARSIGYDRWGRVLQRFLKKDQSLGERLILELTEDSIMTMPEIVLDFMGRMQEHAIAFAIDDFGATNLGVRHFRDFFFDAVKIDGRYVRGIHANYDQQALTRSLLAFAREMDMFTIAESVETPEDAAFLISAGVDCLQGFLFGAPTVRPPWIEADARKMA
ncbi:MAG: EAL domain-containing protein [Rhodobacteraceae bacterium]|nr:EAL domain-containing protein [Paracoccaceae bacterium]